MKSAESNGVTRYRFPAFTRLPGVTHGIFERRGGVSRGSFASLNVSLGIGDDPESVRANRQRIAAHLGDLPAVYLNQVHGARILTLKADDDPGNFFTDPPPEADAVITDRRLTLLMIQVGDCQPVLMADPVRAVIANVHSGWRGSIADIAGQTVREMASRFGCDPADIVAGIGPSLGPCCAEFVHYRREIPPAFWAYKSADDHFDFWAVTRDQLMAQGVLESHIHTSGLCTRCDAARFYSYRAQKRTGRFAAAIALI